MPVLMRRRSWRQRLLSWPWRPWRSWEEIGAIVSFVFDPSDPRGTMMNVVYENEEESPET